MIRHISLAFFGALLIAVGAIAPAAAQSQHEQIVEYYGGAYEDPDMQAYVRGIVNRLEPHANLDRPIRHVTVLDTPIVNAFATAEGGVYVTRGIIALANSEDELAAVIGHEIAHVAERHGQDRQGASLITGLVGLGLQVAGAGDWAMLGYEVGANLGLSSYSRGQEADADRLGVRYLWRAGYDPYAMHDFFYSMQADADLQRTIQGQGGERIALMEFFSTHPNTEGRIEATYERASRRTEENEIPRTVVPFMQQINGMLYGDAEEQGFVRGQTFYHPELGFTFHVPEGYRLQNGQTAVNARADDNSNIRFDMGQASGRSLASYLVNDVAREINVELYNPQTFTLNGIAAANARGQAIVNNRRLDVFVVAFNAGGGNVYRFIMSGPAGRTFAERGWFDTQDSFRFLSENEMASLHGYYVSTFRVRAGDTAERLAAGMAFDDFEVERFRALNGMRRRDVLEQGQWVKLVVSD